MPTDRDQLIAYGHLLAKLDYIQWLAINTSRTAVRGRLSRLVSAPAANYPQLRVEAEPWITKLMARNKVWVAREIADISRAIGQELPETLTAAEYETLQADYQGW